MRYTACRRQGATEGQLMSLFMGIDGGGSNLRVVITDRTLAQRAEAYRGSANPSLIGRDAAAEMIRDAMREALQQVDGARVVAVGIGVAGASKQVAGDWLDQVVHAVLPVAHVAAASDNEIALVGALGKREGLLLLAGTGSVGFGVNAAGASLQVGGWGYLLGDEGSGYWLGLQALKQVAHSLDAGKPASALVQTIQREYGLTSARDLIQWVYHHDANPIPQIARIAPLVLDVAAAGDASARGIVERGGQALVSIAETIKTRLAMPQPAIGLAGGLLRADNPLSRFVQARLGLDELPQPLYTPVIGAALLARLTYDARQTSYS
jgi:glucosamine kinase